MATGQMTIRATHEGAELRRKAVHMVTRYGKADGEGGRALRLTHRAFAAAFGHIDGLRDAIDEIEARDGRIGFFIMPDCVHISLAAR